MKPGSVTAVFLEAAGAFSMRRLLRPISTDCHAAPPSSMAAGAIDKEQRAGRPLAGLHLREILPADQVSHCARDWEQQRVWRAPAPLESPRERWPGPLMLGIERHNLSERFIAGEHAIQGIEFLQRALPEGSAFVLLHEGAKPLAKSPGLRRHRIEFSRDGALLKASTHGGGNQAGGIPHGPDRDLTVQEALPDQQP
jgi:hypothetical protein